MTTSASGPPPDDPAAVDDVDQTDDPRRWSPGIVVGVACLLVGVAMIAFSLIDDAAEPTTSAGPTTTAAVEVPVAPDLDTGTTAPLGGAGLGEVTAPSAGGRSTLRGFGEVTATITAPDGEVCEVCLLSATTPEQRARGLMEVTDPSLGGYDGMLFEFPVAGPGAFWMRNTPLPLSIAYYDERGAWVSGADMEPCEDSADCPSYPAEDSFAFALEVPQGQLSELGAVEGSTLLVNSRTCPDAQEGS